MQAIPDVIQRKERVFFDLSICINELHELRKDISFVDLEDIELACQNLHQLIKDKQLQEPLLYQVSR